MLKEKIRKELERRFTASHFESIQITMNSDGAQLILTPCGQEARLQSVGEIEYVLCEGPIFAHWLQGDLDELADNLAKYDAIKNDFARSEQGLKKFLTKTMKNKGLSYDSPEFAQFSDWHKNLYCRRPTDWEIRRPSNGTH